MKHFWPQPPYEGTLPSPGDAEMSKVVRKDMDAYVKELKDWKKEAGMKVGMLKKENILQAFQNVSLKVDFFLSLSSFFTIWVRKSGKCLVG